MTESHEIVSGLVASRASLEGMMKELEDRGFNREDVSLVMSEVTRNRDYTGDALTRGAGAGIVAGGLLGLIIGTLVVIPGGFFVAGPMLGLLTGGTLGALAGTMAQMILHIGIPQEQTRLYEKTLLAEPGSVLVAIHVRPGQHISEVETIFKMFGARRVSVAGPARFSE